MDSKTPTVLVVADIHSPEIDSKLVQEWEGWGSVRKIQETLEENGERTEIVDSAPALLQRIAEYVNLPFADRPVLFHLVEGFHSRNRESWLPGVAEYFGFPHTGSDAYAQNLSLDKHLSKLWAISRGVPSADWGIWNHSVEVPTNPASALAFGTSIPSSLPGFLGDRLPEEKDFPVFFKPRYEGSSLGIGEENLVSDSSSLLGFMKTKAPSHKSWIWEKYLSGEEWTLAVIGSAQAGYRASSVARIGLEEADEKVYGERTKTKATMPEKLHFDLDSSREEKIGKLSLELCQSLGTSGAVRLDWKADEKGIPFFLEWNLTPGLSSYYSSYPICYSRNLGDYSELLSRLVGIAREEFQTERFSYSKFIKEEQRLPL